MRQQLPDIAAGASCRNVCEAKLARFSLEN